MRHSLIHHPATPPDHVRDVSATLSRDKNGALAISFAASPARTILVPDSTLPGRADELWKTTCFEAFVGHPQAGYTEFNFSPSGQWASYFFDWYRDGMRPAIWLPDPTVSYAIDDDTVLLDTTIELGEHRRDGASHLALSAVIEELSGTKSYWALAHPDGSPDFHDVAGFVLKLPAATSSLRGA